MNAETLLSRLDHPRQTGPDRWLARCPAHADKTPSLSIRELDDERVLIHCFGGCSVEAILQAVDLEFGDLFPPRAVTDTYIKPERRPFPAADILKALAFEVSVVQCAARDMLEAGDLTLGASEFERMELACQRIQSALSLAQGGFRHG